MWWEFVGNMFLMSMIFGGGILFIIVNVNYKPDSSDKDCDDD